MLAPYLLTAVALLVVIWYFKTSKNGYNLPPGPPRLPLLGNLLLMLRRHQFLVFQDLRKKYGDVFTFSMGNMHTIALNTYEAVQECYQQNGDLFSGRPQIEGFKKLTRDCGVLFTEGETWKYHRRLTLRFLRDFGFGRSGAEEIVTFEANELCKELEKIASRGESTTTSKIMCDSINSVISQLVFGERPAFDDADFARYATVATESIQEVRVVHNVTLLVPQLKFLGNVFPVLNKAVSDLEFCHAYVQKKIDMHAAEMDDSADGDCKNFCESYIRAQRKAVAAGESFDDFHLVRTMFELFIAGTDTTSTTLRWSFVYMALNPGVQSKVQEELDRVLGRERQANMADKQVLHYVTATLDEVHRMASLVPISVPHRAYTDTKYKNFDIPASYAVSANLYAIHYDPEWFAQPQKFMPERYIDSSGRYQADSHIIPFSIGKRACLGESLARMELHIFFCTIFQRFSVALDDVGPPQMEALMLGSTGVRAPGPHKIKFVLRD